MVTNYSTGNGEPLQPKTLSPRIFKFLKTHANKLQEHERIVVLSFTAYPFKDYVPMTPDRYNGGERLPSHMVIPCIRFLVDKKFHVLGSLFFHSEFLTENPDKFGKDMSECIKLYILALDNIDIKVAATVCPLNAIFHHAFEILTQVPFLEEFDGLLVYSVGRNQEIVHIHEPKFVRDAFLRWFLLFDLEFTLNGNNFRASKYDIIDTLEINNQVPMLDKSTTNTLYYQQVAFYYFTEAVSLNIRRFIKKGYLAPEALGTSIFVNMFRQVIHSIYGLSGVKCQNFDFDRVDEYIEYIRSIKPTPGAYLSDDDYPIDTYEEKKVVNKNLNALERLVDKANPKALQGKNMYEPIMFRTASGKTFMPVDDFPEKNKKTKNRKKNKKERKRRKELEARLQQNKAIEEPKGNIVQNIPSNTSIESEFMRSCRKKQNIPPQDKVKTPAVSQKMVTTTQKETSKENVALKNNLSMEQNTLKSLNVNDNIKQCKKTNNSNLAVRKIDLDDESNKENVIKKNEKNEKKDDVDEKLRNINLDDEIKDISYSISDTDTECQFSHSSGLVSSDLKNEEVLSRETMDVLMHDYLTKDQLKKLMTTESAFGTVPKFDSFIQFLKDRNSQYSEKLKDVRSSTDVSKGDFIKFSVGCDDKVNIERMNVDNLKSPVKVAATKGSSSDPRNMPLKKRFTRLHWDAAGSSASSNISGGSDSPTSAREENTEILENKDAIQVTEVSKLNISSNNDKYQPVVKVIKDYLSGGGNIESKTPSIENSAKICVDVAESSVSGRGVEEGKETQPKTTLIECSSLIDEITTRNAKSALKKLNDDDCGQLVSTSMEASISRDEKKESTISLDDFSNQNNKVAINIVESRIPLIENPSQIDIDVIKTLKSDLIPLLTSLVAPAADEEGIECRISYEVDEIATRNVRCALKISEHSDESPVSTSPKIPGCEGNESRIFKCSKQSNKATIYNITSDPVCSQFETGSTSISCEERVSSKTPLAEHSYKLEDVGESVELSASLDGKLESVTTSSELDEDVNYDSSLSPDSTSMMVPLACEALCSLSLNKVSTQYLESGFNATNIELENSMIPIACEALVSMSLNETPNQINEVEIQNNESGVNTTNIQEATNAMIPIACETLCRMSLNESPTQISDVVKQNIKPPLNTTNLHAVETSIKASKPGYDETEPSTVLVKCSSPVSNISASESSLPVSTCEGLPLSDSDDSAPRKSPIRSSYVIDEITTKNVRSAQKIANESDCPSPVPTSSKEKIKSDIPVLDTSKDNDSLSLSTSMKVFLYNKEKKDSQKLDSTTFQSDQVASESFGSSLGSDCSRPVSTGFSSCDRDKAENTVISDEVEMVANMKLPVLTCTENMSARRQKSEYSSSLIDSLNEIDQVSSSSPECLQVPTNTEVPVDDKESLESKALLTKSSSQIQFYQRPVSTVVKSSVVEDVSSRTGSLISSNTEVSSSSTVTMETGTVPKETGAQKKRNVSRTKGLSKRVRENNEKNLVKTGSKESDNLQVDFSICDPVKTEPINLNTGNPRKIERVTLDLSDSSNESLNNFKSNYISDHYNFLKSIESSENVVEGYSCDLKNLEYYEDAMFSDVSSCSDPGELSSLHDGLEGSSGVKLNNLCSSTKKMSSDQIPRLLNPKKSTNLNQSSSTVHDCYSSDSDGDCAVIQRLKEEKMKLEELQREQMICDTLLNDQLDFNSEYDDYDDAVINKHVKMIINKLEEKDEEIARVIDRLDTAENTSLLPSSVKEQSSKRGFIKKEIYTEGSSSAPGATKRTIFHRDKTEDSKAPAENVIKSDEQSCDKSKISSTKASYIETLGVKNDTKLDNIREEQYKKVANTISQTIRKFANMFNLPDSDKEKATRISQASLNFVYDVTRVGDELDLKTREKQFDDAFDRLCLALLGSSGFNPDAQDKMKELMPILQEIAGPNQTIDAPADNILSKHVNKTISSSLTPQHYFTPGMSRFVREDVKNLWINNIKGIERLFKRLKTLNKVYIPYLSPDIFLTDHVEIFMKHVQIYGPRHEIFPSDKRCEPVDLLECFDTLKPHGSSLLLDG